MNTPNQNKTANETDNHCRNLLNRLDECLSSGDVDSLLTSFNNDCFWRDLVSFTWNVKTLEGKEQIRAMLMQQLEAISPHSWKLDSKQPVDEKNGVTSCWFYFETGAGRGYGHLRIRDGRIWTLVTTLQELTGYEETTGFNRPRGTGETPGSQTWKQSRQIEQDSIGYKYQPYVLIVGGGQGGMALGARLRQLQVPTLIIDRNERPGDAWRNRYETLCLHDPVWYDHMPYLPFPPNWPIYTPKDKMGDWLQMYSDIMELNYWPKTIAESASYDDSRQRWDVLVTRESKTIELHPQHLVLATGMSGKPHVPRFPGRDQFKGEQHHSSEHAGPDHYRGQRVVVVGSNNSAHDIASAMCEHCDVTMIQRSPTMVARVRSLMEFAIGPLFSEQAVQQGITTERADLMLASTPHRLRPAFTNPAWQSVLEHDREFYAELEAVGFDIDYADGGIHMKYLQRGSGYYIDVGACQMVIDRKIKLAHGDIKELTEHSVVMESGQEIAADLLVYATGYGSMNAWAADLISQEVADKVGKVWGLGSDTPKDPGPWEGELRNMWKPTRQDALWFHGGNLQQSRHFSQFLSLQLKARYEGLDTPVYGLQEVHHLA